MSLRLDGERDCNWVCSGGVSIVSGKGSTVGDCTCGESSSKLNRDKADLEQLGNGVMDEREVVDMVNLVCFFLRSLRVEVFLTVVC